jgi:hypothetical protein
MRRGSIHQIPAGTRREKPDGSAQRRAVSLRRPIRSVCLPSRHPARKKPDGRRAAPKTVLAQPKLRQKTAGMPLVSNLERVF